MTTSLAHGEDEEQPDALFPVAFLQKSSNNPATFIPLVLVTKPTGRITLWLDILFLTNV